MVQSERQDPASAWRPRSGVAAIWLCAAGLSLVVVSVGSADEVLSSTAASATPSQPHSVTVPGVLTPAAPRSDSEPPEYGEEIDAALHEHGRGHFQEARAHLLQAHRIFPNARTLRGLGNVEFELRNYGEAVNYLAAALKSDIRPLDPELRDETDKVLRRAKVYVGEVHVDIQPDSATVLVDGVAIASGSQASLALVVGDHMLEFHALGRVSERRAIRIQGGEHASIRVTLDTIEKPSAEAGAQRIGAPAGPLRVPASNDDHVPARRKWWVWTVVGAAVVAAVVTGVAVGVSRRDEHHVERAPTSPNTPEGVTISALRVH